MAGALDGVRIIDFGQYIAGPLAAMLLADQGADVVRVDPPGGPAWDSAANATYNRNKRSIVLDLKADADRDVARRLIEGADVVIENFRPGVMERLGLGAAKMTAANPRLIYCSIPGFASDDPRAQAPGWEGIVSAATGCYPLRPGAVSSRVHGNAHPFDLRRHPGRRGHHHGPQRPRARWRRPGGGGAAVRRYLCRHRLWRPAHPQPGAARRHAADGARRRRPTR